MIPKSYVSAALILAAILSEVIGGIIYRKKKRQDIYDCFSYISWFLLGGAVGLMFS